MDRRSLIKTMVAMPLVAGIASAAAQEPRSIIRARRLRKGMTIGLVSPASNAAEDEDIALCQRRCYIAGFPCKTGKTPIPHEISISQARISSGRMTLTQCFADREVDAIFCLRGGYGSSRLLPLLDYKNIAVNPKVLMGYSDITALLCAIHQRTGLVTFHGPIVGDNFSDYSYSQFKRTLVSAKKGQSLAAPPPFDDPAARSRGEGKSFDPDPRWHGAGGP